MACINVHIVVENFYLSTKFIVYVKFLERAFKILETRIGCLEKQLAVFQHDILSPLSQLRDVLNDMVCHTII